MPRSPSAPLTDFKAWERELNLVCRKRLGMGLFDLPDVATRSGFDAGTSPDEFFHEEVVPRVREDFGSLVDEALDESDE